MIASSSKPQTRTYGKRFKPEEWEVHRTEICRLFLMRNNTLETVAKSMSELYNFHATPKQYKHRLKIWDVKKNNCRQERNQNQRQSALQEEGHKTSMMIGGQGTDTDVDIQSITQLDLPPFIASSRIQSVTALKPPTQNDNTHPFHDNYCHSEAYSTSCNYPMLHTDEMDLDSSGFGTHIARTYSQFGAEAYGTSNVNLVSAQELITRQSSPPPPSPDWSLINFQDPLTNTWEGLQETHIRSPLAESQDSAALTIDSIHHARPSGDWDPLSTAPAGPETAFPLCANPAQKGFTISGSLEGAVSSMCLFVSVLTRVLEESNSAWRAPPSVSMNIPWIRYEFTDLVSKVTSEYSKTLEHLYQPNLSLRIPDRNIRGLEGIGRFHSGSADAHLQRVNIRQKTAIASYHVVTGVGSIFLTFSTVSRMESPLEPGSSSMITIDVSFVPKPDCSKAGFSARFWRYLQPTPNLPKLAPHITTFNVVENDTGAFRYARAGDLEGIKALLRSGEANLRDCNESGDTLLAVCVHWNKLHVARFLLQEGADPENCDQAGRSALSKFDMFRVNMVFLFRQSLELFQLIFRRDWDADSIFTAEIGLSRSTYCDWFMVLSNFCEYPGFDRKDLLTRLNQAIMPNLETRNTEGYSVLLQSLRCRGFYMYYNLEASTTFVEYLLSQGADPQTKDDIGNGALHILLSLPESHPGLLYQCLGCPNSSWADTEMLEQFSRLLEIFLQRGCDPSSKNEFGYTPSDIAIWHPMVWDTWCSALETTGLSPGGILRAEDKANGMQQGNEVGAYSINIEVQECISSEVGEENESDEAMQDEEMQDEEMQDEEMQDEEMQEEESLDDQDSGNEEAVRINEQSGDSENGGWDNESRNNEEIKLFGIAPFDIWIPRRVYVAKGMLESWEANSDREYYYMIPSLETSWSYAAYTNDTPTLTYTTYLKQKLNELQQTKPCISGEDGGNNVTWKDFSDRKWEALQLYETGRAKRAANARYER